MADGIPTVSVQALTAFFSKHFEPPKTSTQPRRKIQQNKGFSKLLEFSSKPDLTACRNSDVSAFSRSVSAFDLPNAGTLSHFAKNLESSLKRKQCLNQMSLSSPPSASTVSNNSICASANLSQNVNYSLDTASNDSGVDENSESSASGDSRHYGKYNFCSVKNSTVLNRNSSVQNSLYSESNSEAAMSPTVNVVVKKPFLESYKQTQSDLINSNKRNIVTTVWNRTYEVDVSTEIEKNLINKPPSDKVFYSEIVISDNYVCKAQYKRTELPLLESLGPPPCKPKKLDDASLLCMFQTSKCQPFNTQTLWSKADGMPAPEASLLETQQVNKLRYESPLSKTSFAQNNLWNKHCQQTVSDVTWNSSQSYQQQQDFCESVENSCSNRNEKISLSRAPSLPPRRLSCPSQFSENCASSNVEELYQDTEAMDEDKLYEEVPFSSSCQPQLYVNQSRSDKIPREVSRLLQKEQRERVRQEREAEKLRKKFGITGEEVPLDKGYIKHDAKGGRGDLSVKKGEAILIIRIEDNPIGRLLAQNERGKIGYVALDNLMVDADSIKVVMRERTHSMGSKEGRYSNSSSSGEAIYEEC